VVIGVNISPFAEPKVLVVVFAVGAATTVVLEVVDGVAEETTATRTEDEVGVSLEVVDDDDLTVSVGVSEGVVSVVVSTVEEVFWPSPPCFLVREVVSGAAGEEVVGVLVSLVVVGGGGSPRPPPPKPPSPVLLGSPLLALGDGGGGVGSLMRGWARIAR
jgi:hypothetical protein